MEGKWNARTIREEIVSDIRLPSRSSWKQRPSGLLRSK